MKLKNLRKMESVSLQIGRDLMNGIIQTPNTLKL